MAAKQSKAGGGTGGDEARTANTRPTYEAPRVVPLGEVARGIGALCAPGSGAFDCYAGNQASDTCDTGSGGTAPP